MVQVRLAESISEWGDTNQPSLAQARSYHEGFYARLSLPHSPNANDVTMLESILNKACPVLDVDVLLSCLSDDDLLTPTR